MGGHERVHPACVHRLIPPPGLLEGRADDEAVGLRIKLEQVVGRDAGTEIEARPAVPAHFGDVGRVRRQPGRNARDDDRIGAHELGGRCGFADPDICGERHVYRAG